MQKVVLEINGKPVHVEVAIRPDDRIIGLAHRLEVPEGSGMLFVYDSEQSLTFWMMGTEVPLSVAFIDESGKIVRLADMTQIRTSKTESGRGRAALEVPLGWFRRNEVKVGDAVGGCPWLKEDA